MTQTTITTEQFSGPLDLLLSLVNEQKLSISELALAEVTEQYLRYLDTLGETRAEELADFLVVASKLLLLKAKTLLPQFLPEEEEPESNLAAQLQLYKTFVDMSKDVRRRWESGYHSSFRVEPRRMPTQFVAPSNLTEKYLYTTMLEVVTRLRPPKPLPETTIDHTISVREKINQIRLLLAERRRFGFTDMIADASNKTEVIVSFLAILELMKQKVVTLRQDQSFHDILIQPVT